MTGYVGPLETQTIDNDLFRQEEPQVVGAGAAVVVPAGRCHNIINGSPPALLKLCTPHSPPNYPPGTVHRTETDTQAAEAVARHPTPVAAPSGQAVRA